MTEPAHMSDDALAQVEAWRLVQQARRTRDMYRTQFVLTGFSCGMLAVGTIRALMGHWDPFFYRLFGLACLGALVLACVHLRRVRRMSAYCKTCEARLQRLENGD